MVLYIGKYSTFSLIDWTRQVVTLVQNDAFFPHPIRRELKSILELFTRKNLGKIKYKGRRIKLDKILPWFADYMGKCELHCFRKKIYHDKLVIFYRNW